MAGIREEIKRYYREGDALAKLILINLGVYITYILVRLVSFLFRSDIHNEMIYWLSLPSDLGKLATRPWTLITYMFTHADFMHILFNMLYLYFAGTLFMQYLGGRKLLSTYLLGGLIGGLLYVAAYNIFPIFTSDPLLANSRNIGASGGVIAIVIAIATYVPNFPVRLFFVVTVKLWIVALILVITDLIFLPEGNAGGHIAHLGGALFGYLSIRSLRNGRDITEWFSRLMDRLANLFKPRPKIKKVYTNTRNDYQYQQYKARNQHQMDEILDKISRSGYDSLSKEEKDFLFKIGKD